jgi:hypothetical protein
MYAKGELKEEMAVSLNKVLYSSDVKEFEQILKRISTGQEYIRSDRMRGKDPRFIGLDEPSKERVLMSKSYDDYMNVQTKLGVLDVEAVGILASLKRLKSFHFVFNGIDNISRGFVFDDGLLTIKDISVMFSDMVIKHNKDVEYETMYPGSLIESSINSKETLLQQYKQGNLTGKVYNFDTDMLIKEFSRGRICDDKNPHEFHRLLVDPRNLAIFRRNGYDYTLNMMQEVFHRGIDRLGILPGGEVKRMAYSQYFGLPETPTHGTKMEWAVDFLTRYRLGEFSYFDFNTYEVLINEGKFTKELKYLQFCVVPGCGNFMVRLGEDPNPMFSSKADMKFFSDYIRRIHYFWSLSMTAGIVDVKPYVETMLRLSTFKRDLYPFILAAFDSLCEVYEFKILVRDKMDKLASRVRTLTERLITMYSQHNDRDFQGVFENDIEVRDEYEGLDRGRPRVEVQEKYKKRDEVQDSYYQQNHFITDLGPKKQNVDLRVTGRGPERPMDIKPKEIPKILTPKEEISWENIPPDTGRDSGVGVKNKELNSMNARELSNDLSKFRGLGDTNGNVNGKSPKEDVRYPSQEPQYRNNYADTNENFSRNRTGENGNQSSFVVRDPFSEVQKFYNNDRAYRHDYDKSEKVSERKSVEDKFNRVYDLIQDNDDDAGYGGRVGE